MNKEVFQNPPMTKSLFQPQPKTELYDSPPPKLTNPITLGLPFPQLKPVVPQSQNVNIQESKYALMSIQDITSQLQSLAKKQIGCRYLQKLIASSQEDIVNKYFFPHLYPAKLLELCQDFFGNYFIQKLIPYLSQENLSSISFLLLSHFPKLSTDPHGTRVIQALNSQVAHIPILLTQFTNAMKMCIPQLINDHNGSFVLLHYASCVPYPNNDIVYQYLNKNIVEVATSPYACCTLQKSIDIANDLQRETLLNTIAEYSMYLVSNQFGNYVIQFALTKNNIKVNDKIAAGLIQNIIFFSKQKYSSNVIEKCFDYCSPKMKEVIINKLCDENNIKELLRDMYGNYVLQKAILNSKENIKNYFLNIIVRDINNLQYLTFGQKLITKLILTFPELRLAVNFNMMSGSNFNQNMFMMNQQMGNMNIGPGPFYQNGFGKAKYQKGKNNNMWNMQNFSNNDSYGNYQYNK